jgi:alpha-1,2-mannosyltransferase
VRFGKSFGKREGTSVMWASARSGDWVNGQRLKIYPLILLAFAALAIAAMIALSHGRLGLDNRPLGTDFSQVWVAGLETLRGHPEEPFDLPRHVGEQHAEFGENSAVYGWHYPPYFLGPAALLAQLPYLQALLLWQLATLILYLASVAAIMRDSRLDAVRVLLIALSFPAVLLNLGHGQNGFLTAVLLAAGFLLLDRRPLVAGALFALLAYKPQFGLVVPAALIATGRWRALLAAGATLALMTIATVAAFGVDCWIAFWKSLALTRAFVLEQGATGFEKIQSVFAAVRLVGGDVQAAYAAQAAVTLATLVAVTLLWRSTADYRVKSAVAILATLLTTPYCLDYDMTALCPAIAFFVAHGLEKGFSPFEKTALVLCFIAPLFARPIATFLPLPIGVAAMLALLMLTLWNEWRRRGSSAGDVLSAYAHAAIQTSVAQKQS